MIVNKGDNQIKAVKCGAISMILGAMKTHIENFRVSEKGCKALLNITLNRIYLISQIRNGFLRNYR